MMGFCNRTSVLITKHTPKQDGKTSEEEEWTVEEDMS
jgi:hypothetical protein